MGIKLKNGVEALWAPIIVLTFPGSSCIVIVIVSAMVGNRGLLQAMRFFSDTLGLAQRDFRPDCACIQGWDANTWIMILGW